MHEQVAKSLVYALAGGNTFMSVRLLLRLIMKLTRFSDNACSREL